jgi:dipicolinate synthase subunit A
MTETSFVVELKDKRDLYLFESLKSDGFDVYIHGDRVDTKNRLVYIMNITSAVDAAFIKKLRRGSYLFCNELDKPALKAICDMKIIHFNYLDDEAFIVKNAYLTAEGTLAHIIENTDVSMLNLKAVVLGYGRVGKAVAKVLKDNYFYIAVVGRSDKTLANATIVADETCSFTNFKDILGSFDVIINTVPELVLEGDALSRVKKDAFLIDLASKPGGIDFEKCRKLNLKCMHALGIPGKTAPKTAGEFIKELIYEALALKGKL